MDTCGRKAVELNFSFIPAIISRGGRVADKLPPAPIFIVDAGLRFRGTRSDLECVSACGRSKISFLQLRRLHANTLREWGVGSGEWEKKKSKSQPHYPLPTPHSPLPVDHPMQVINYKSKAFR